MIFAATATTEEAEHASTSRRFDRRLDDRREFCERLRERDPDALERFFDLYFDRIYRYVCRSVADEHSAEDLTQEIFMNIHRSLPSYEPSRGLEPWIFTIATNRVRDHWRSRHHRESFRQVSVESDGVADQVSVSPNTDPERAELAQQVRAAINQLSETSRTTILLRAYEGLSFEAIGRIVGHNEVAVRKRYSRALSTLRQSLERTSAIL